MSEEAGVTGVAGGRAAPDGHGAGGGPDVAVWARGRLRDPAEPLFGATDHGVTVGDGVFETCAVVRGRAFALTRHLERLDRSARGMGLPPADRAEVRAGILAVLGAAPAAGRVRVTLVAGSGPAGSGRGTAPPTVVVVASPAHPSRPARVVRVPWTRNERSAVAGLKTTSYAENVVALAEALRAGADEALLANTVGELCEGTGSNVFVERGGELVTPPLSSGCLAGVTRELVLEWSGRAGLPVREARPGELPWEVLEEVLDGTARLAVTGSVRGVVPVIALDGHRVEPGPITGRVAEEYADRLRDDLDP